jgi:hypothetical protein
MAARSKSKSKSKGKSTRTTHRSSSGNKLYAKRTASGRFKDIQTYERAHERDIKRKAKSESASKKK